MFSLVRASTHLTNTHHSANVGRTLTQKPACVVEAALCVWVSLTKSSSVTTTYTKEIQVDSVEGQTTMNTVEPIMLATHRETQVQFPGDRMRVPDPLSDVQSVQNYFPKRGLTTTGPGCLAFSPVYH